MESISSSIPSSSHNGKHNGNGRYQESRTASRTTVLPPSFANSGPVPIEGAANSLLSAWQLQAQQEEENDLRNLISIARRRAWIIAGVAATTMALIVGYTVQQEEIFQSQFRVLVEPVDADDDFSELTSVLGEQNLNSSGLDYETQVQVLRSPELIEPLSEQLQQRYPELDYLTLLENLVITRLGDTKILEVSYSSPDPVQVQVVLDKVAETYLRYSLEERQTNLRQGINFIENQLPELKNQVDVIQGQLETFRRQYNFITPEIQAAQLSEQADSLSVQRLNLNQQLAEVQQIFANLQSQSGALGALEQAPIYEQLLSELRTVEQEIAQELTRFSPNSLSIRVLEERRENLLPLLQQEAQRVVGTREAVANNEFNIVAAQSEVLSRAEAAVAQGSSQLPTLIRQYTDLQRELEIATEALTRFRTTRQTLEIEAAQTEIPWQLIEVPMQPTEPISPNLKRSLLLGIVASLLAGLGAALLIERLDNVYHSVDELKAGTKLPLLGMLPHNRTLQEMREGSVFSKLADGFSWLGRGRKSSYYGYGGDSESAFIEALRVMHTNIRMLSSDRSIRSILVSSAQPGDGKSTVSANLAQVATAMGQRVLVVDVDLRKPQVHNRLSVSNAMGLSNLIADDLPVKAGIQQLTPNGQLFVLTAGKIPPDPAKLLASQKMQQLMATFESCFDLVIYDAPPATGLADVSLIGQRTDGLVLITRMGRTDRTVLNQTIDTLNLAQIPVLGVVANGIHPEGIGGYRYYGYAQEETAEESAFVSVASSDSAANKIGERDVF